MALHSDGPAPYAPPAAVVSFIEAFRDRGLASPFTTDVLIRAGVNESLAPRTLTALKLLDLIDDDGQPTDTLQTLRKVASAEYQAAVASWIREVYADVFQFVDPAQADHDRVLDAFRTFTPHGQRTRMVTLFLGLCQHAGIVDGESPKPRQRPKPASKPTQKATRPPRKSTTQQDLPEATDPPNAVNPFVRPVPTQEGHPLLDGLFAALPPVGSVWSKEDREAWTAAALANFSLIYKLAPDHAKGGGGD